MTQLRSAIQSSVRRMPVNRADVSASSIVHKTLAEAGPQTTTTLHVTLHSLYPSMLPARPPPTSFLAGARRVLRARELGVPPSSLPLTRDNFPGKDESSEGSWSMSYLKHRVLKPMEERGEVLKITRGRWNRLAPGDSAAAEAEAAAAVAQAGAQGDSKGKKSTKREDEEHVWVTKAMWEERSAAGKESRDEFSAAKRSSDRVEGDRELREKYGLPAQ